MPARNHFTGRQAVELRIINQHDRVAKRESDVQVVCGKQDTLSFLLRQLPEKQTEFVAVGQVKEGGRFVEQDDKVSCARARAIMMRWHSPSDILSIVFSA